MAVTNKILALALASAAAIGFSASASAATVISYDVKVDGVSQGYVFNLNPTPGAYHFQTLGTEVWVEGAVTGSPALPEPRLTTNALKLNMSNTTTAHTVIVTITQSGLTFPGTDFRAIATNNFLNDGGVTGTVSATLNGVALTSLTTGSNDGGFASGGFKVPHGPTYDEVVTYTFNVAAGAATGNSATSTYSITALPEAGTWMMMVAGFGLMGATMRRRPRAQVTFA